MSDGVDWAAILIGVAVAVALTGAVWAFVSAVVP